MYLLKHIICFFVQGSSSKISLTRTSLVCFILIHVLTQVKLSNYGSIINFGLENVGNYLQSSNQ